MRIESVDFFYAAMPTVTLEADGSQDALLVRVTADGHQGWGECEASPLTSIAAFVTPRSHGVCQPVSASVIGQHLNGPEDIARIAETVERNSMDLLQAAHTWSGIEIALWDLLGNATQRPVWSLLGYSQSHPKTPYASMLFGRDPQDTLEHVRAGIARGFRAIKLGWAGYGEGATPADVARDAEHLMAAREALGDDGILLVDAGQIWGDNPELALPRLAALETAGARWIEEPFAAHAYRSHAILAEQATTVGVAGGEGAHNLHMAVNLIDYGKVRFVQIDTGRVGGIGPAKAIADYAAARGVCYVNHTFTSHLALSASLQPYAGLAEHTICEYPAEPKTLAVDLSANHLTPDENGHVWAPDAPGLGVQVDLDALQPYLQSVEIRVNGQVLFHSP